MDEGMSKSRQWIIGQDRALRVTLIERDGGVEARLIFMAGQMRSLLFSGFYRTEGDAKLALLEQVLKVSIGTVHCASWLADEMCILSRKCHGCRFFWEIDAEHGACCVTSGSERTMVKSDTSACDRFEVRENVLPFPKGDRL